MPIREWETVEKIQGNLEKVLVKLIKYLEKHGRNFEKFSET